MHDIDIQITKAVIASFSVEFEEEQPIVSATIALYSSNDKRVSTFTASNRFYSNVKLDLPPTIIPPIKEIAWRLEGLLASACNKAMCLLDVKPKEERATS